MVDSGANVIMLYPLSSRDPEMDLAVGEHSRILTDQTQEGAKSGYGRTSVGVAIVMPTFLGGHFLFPRNISLYILLV